MKEARRRLLTGLMALGFAALLPAAPTRAQEGDKPKTVTMTGTLVRLGSDRDRTQGAGAAANIYGQTHALKTEEGKYYTFLGNQRSAPLFRGGTLLGKQVEVQGTVLPGSQIIQVTSYRVLDTTKQAGESAKTQTATLHVAGMT